MSGKNADNDADWYDDVDVVAPFVSKKGLIYRRDTKGDGGSALVEIGTDEVGRGPLFGRTYAAAVALPPLRALSAEGRAVLALARDSKTVPRAKMAALAADIRRTVRAFSVQHVEAVDIDGMNIRQAVIQAMREAVCDVRAQLGDCGGGGGCYVLADGRDLPSPVECCDGALPVVAEVKADARYVSVACAAILAKDAHDAHIRELCREHPALVQRYGLDTNMGYGTKAHLAGLDLHGPTHWHRQSFAPVLRATIKFAHQARDPGVGAGTDSSALHVPHQRYFRDAVADDDAATTTALSVAPPNKKSGKKKKEEYYQKNWRCCAFNDDDGNDDDYQL